jgi:hypothetical protein
MVSARAEAGAEAKGWRAMGMNGTAILYRVGIEPQVDTSVKASDWESQGPSANRDKQTFIAGGHRSLARRRCLCEK